MSEENIAKRNVVSAYKAGRSFNGAHRDAGIIIHLVPALTSSTNGFWGDKALCGVKPGNRGYGWANTYMAPTCEKCIKKNKTKTLGL
jgi:hypothetical protein